MADQPIQVEIISSSGHTYTTCLIPAEINCPDEMRESSIDINPGHRPSVARLWIVASEWKRFRDNNEDAFDGFSLGTGIISGVRFSIKIIAPTGNVSSPATPTIQQTNSRSCWIFQSGVLVYDGIGDGIYQLTLVTKQWEWAYLSAPSLTRIGTYPGQSAGGGAIINALTLYGGGSCWVFASGATTITSPMTASDVWDKLFEAINNCNTSPPAYGINKPAWADASGWVPYNFNASQPMAYLLRYMLETTYYQLVSDPWTAGGSEVNSPLLSLEKLGYDSTDFTQKIVNVYNVAGHAGYNPSAPDSKINYPPPFGTAKTDTQYDGPTGTGSTYLQSNISPVPMPYGMIADDGSTAQSIPFIGGSGPFKQINGVVNSFEGGTDTGASNYQNLTIPPYCVVFAGLWNHLPGKNIRKVKISWDGDGIFTTVWTHPWFEDEGAMRFEGTSVRSVGGGWNLVADGGTSAAYAARRPTPLPQLCGEGVYRSGPNGAAQVQIDLRHIARVAILELLPAQANFSGDNGNDDVGQAPYSPPFSTLLSGSYRAKIIVGDTSGNTSFETGGTDSGLEYSAAYFPLDADGELTGVIDHSRTVRVIGIFVGFDATNKIAYYMGVGGRGTEDLGTEITPGQSTARPSWTRGDVTTGAATDGGGAVSIYVSNTGLSGTNLTIIEKFRLDFDSRGMLFQAIRQ